MRLTGKNRTITDAINQVMGLAKKPLTVKEVYHLIVQEGFYEFHADSPEHVVRSQIRRHCDGLDFPSASPTKLFRLVGKTGTRK